MSGGGCSGFQYGFTFDEVANEDDTTMEKNGVMLHDSMIPVLGRRRDRLPEGLEGAVRHSKPNATTTLRLWIVVLGPSLTPLHE